MKNKIFIFAFFSVLVLAVTWAFAHNHIDNYNRHHQTKSVENAQNLCPVMGKEINKKVFVDHKGKRIYFCCTGCVDKFNENPEKYLKILQKQEVNLEATPQCGNCNNQECNCQKTSKRGCSGGGCSGTQTTKT